MLIYKGNKIFYDAIVKGGYYPPRMDEWKLVAGQSNDEKHPLAETQNRGIYRKELAKRQEGVFIGWSEMRYGIVTRISGFGSRLPEGEFWVDGTLTVAMVEPLGNSSSQYLIPVRVSHADLYIVPESAEEVPAPEDYDFYADSKAERGFYDFMNMENVTKEVEK